MASSWTPGRSVRRADGKHFYPAGLGQTPTLRAVPESVEQTDAEEDKGCMKNENERDGRAMTTTPSHMGVGYEKAKADAS